MEHWGDNEMPCSRVNMDLEMVATMNHTWGYKRTTKTGRARKIFFAH